MEDLAYTSVLWLTRRLGGKKPIWMHKIDILATISVQLAAPTKKVDGWTINQTMNIVQAARLRCDHCRGEHESVDCNVRSPYIQLDDHVNYMQNYQGSKTIPIPIHTIWVRKIIPISPGTIIVVSKCIILECINWFSVIRKEVLMGKNIEQNGSIINWSTD